MKLTRVVLKSADPISGRRQILADEHTTLEMLGGFNVIRVTQGKVAHLYPISDILMATMEAVPEVPVPTTPPSVVVDAAQLRPKGGKK